MASDTDDNGLLLFISVLVACDAIIRAVKLQF